jgi:uncharacterized membrane protein (UPF0136 family)
MDNRLSRRIWGGLVLAIGVLWTVGGIVGYFQGRGAGMFLLVFCGVALLRLGGNLMR